MARRSILSSVLDDHPRSAGPIQTTVEPVPTRASSVKPSRSDKLHIGGYYSPENSTIIAFQKLGIDLRKSQQEMLLEALGDFVAKHQAASAFR